MTCLVMDGGKKIDIDDDLFDVLWNSIEEPEEEETSKEEKRKRNKKLSNDKHNKLNKERGYFKDYYKSNDRCYECERCGKMISSGTNKSKHQKTKRCISNYEDKLEKEITDKIVNKVLLWN